VPSESTLLSTQPVASMASVPRLERHPQVEDVELSGEVLNRAIVGCDTTDT
jgi:hypothetical protein